jgi:DNA replication protein DnaC
VLLAEIGTEFLFHIVAERAEKAAVVLTTNLPFSEWTQVIPNARNCKALLNRITDRAHILETSTESYSFRRTEEKQKKGAKTWPGVKVSNVSWSPGIVLYCMF